MNKRAMAEKILSIWNPTGRLLAAEYVESKEEFYPLCLNKFDKKAGCRIEKGKRGPCEGCPVKEYEVLSLELVEAHLSGKRRIGCYPLRRDDTLPGDVITWAAADIDGHKESQDPHSDIRKLVDLCTVLDIPLLIFSSNSGNGYHAYLFFSSAVKAYGARALMLALLERAGIDIRPRAGSFDAIFPKQDSLSDNEMGNLIALPWSGKALEERQATQLLDPSTMKPFPENFDTFLELYRPMHSDELDGLLREMGIDPEPRREKAQRPAPDGRGIQWDGKIRSLPVSDRIKTAILDPPEKNDRSEEEMSVLVALVAAGLSDDQIFQIWETERIGDRYRERGESRKWMQGQIAKGRDWVGRNAAPEFADRAAGDKKPKINHLEVARQVLASFGNENVIHSGPFTCLWNGCGVWHPMDDREIKQRVHEIAGGMGLTRNTIGSIVDMFQTEAFKPGHRFDLDRQAINVLNGELHWNDKWELRPHSREAYRTTQLPVAYDPKAKAPRRFSQFLNEIFHGDEDRFEKAHIVFEAIGYSLLSSCEYEKFFLLIGPGANGKSVLMDTMGALVGPQHVCAVQPSQFENRFQRAHLHGKLVNLVTEIAEGHEIADAQLKAIVSGELTTAEHKLKPPFDFYPFATCWFGTNHMPHTRDFSDALFRRAIILTFNRVFTEPEQDKQLKVKLRAELSGILNMALSALAGVFRRGHFTTAESCEEAKREWRVNCDQVSQFIEECCVLGPGKTEISNKVYFAYESWTRTAGIRRVLNRNNFTSRLRRQGVDPCKGTAGARLLAGIELKT